MSSAAPFRPRSGLQALPVDGVPAEVDAGAEQQREGECGQQVQGEARRAPQRPKVQRQPRASGRAASSASRTRPRKETSTTAPTRIRARTLDRARSVRARSRSSAPDPRDGGQGHVPRPRREARELPGQGLRVDPGAAAQREPHVDGDHGTLAAPARTSSDIQRGHWPRAAARPGPLPGPIARRVSRAGAKGSSRKPAATSSRSQVVRRPLQGEPAQLRQAPLEPAAPHQPVGGGGDLRLRPQPRRQELAAPRAARSSASPRVAPAQDHREGVEPHGEGLHQQPLGLGRRGVGRPQRPQVGGELEARDPPAGRPR